MLRDVVIHKNEMRAREGTSALLQNKLFIETSITVIKTENLKPIKFVETFLIFYDVVP